MRDRDGAVNLWRCYVPETYNRSYFGRMWAFLAFIFSASTAALRAGKADVVIATSPPLTVAIPGWIAARLKSGKLIFEVRDLWPESAVTTGVLHENGTLTQMLYSLEKWAYKSAGLINVLTPAFKSDIAKRSLKAESDIVLVPNGADLDLFHPGLRDNEARRTFGWEDRFVAMYSGAHGKANALGQLVNAAEILKGREDILIACVGDGPERPGLVEAAKVKGLKNIVFYGAQPKERMPSIINASDLGIAVLQENPTFRTVYPNKVFDYMACARPTLLAIDGVARKLLCDEARAGVYVEPENASAIAAAIKRLSETPQECAEMGMRGREWVVKNAGREALARKYLEIMKTLTSA